MYFLLLILKLNNNNKYYFNLIISIGLYFNINHFYKLSLKIFKSYFINKLNFSDLNKNYLNRFI